MSSSSSPCAACKCLRRKCTPECVFAPYFPPEKPEKFACVHKVFGASNVSKILNELNPLQREEAVNSLAYEAEARLREPIYGCVAFISILQQRLKQVHEELGRAKRELSLYMQQQPNGEYPFLTNNFSTSSFIPYNNIPINNPQLVIREPQLNQGLEAQAQEMMRAAFEQQQQQQEMMLFEGGLHNYNQIGSTSMHVPVPALGLGTHENANYDQVQEHFHNLQIQAQEQLMTQQQRSGSEEGASPTVDPSY